MSNSNHRLVKLISGDGFEFIIDYRAACVSKTLRNMLAAYGCFKESTLGEIQLKELSGKVLEQACRYFYYHLQYQNSDGPTPPTFNVDPSIAIELLLAANYLDT